MIWRIRFPAGIYYASTHWYISHAEYLSLYHSYKGLRLPCVYNVCCPKTPNYCHYESPLILIYRASMALPWTGVSSVCQKQRIVRIERVGHALARVNVEGLGFQLPFNAVAWDFSTYDRNTSMTLHLWIWRWLFVSRRRGSFTWQFIMQSKLMKSNSLIVMIHWHGYVKWHQTTYTRRYAYVCLLMLFCLNNEGSKFLSSSSYNYNVN